MKVCKDCPENTTCWTIQMIAFMLEKGIKVTKAHCPKYRFEIKAGK